MNEAVERSIARTRALFRQAFSRHVKLNKVKNEAPVQSIGQILADRQPLINPSAAPVSSVEVEQPVAQALEAANYYQAARRGIIAGLVVAAVLVGLWLIG